MDTVRDILASKGNDIVSISPDATLYEALEKMADHNIGAVLVIDENEKIRGMFTERNFVRKIMIKGRSGEITKVKEVMTSQVLYVSLDASVSDCMNLMTEKRMRHLLVMDGEKAVGIVSIGDVVKAVLLSQKQQLSEQAFQIGQMERYISGGP